MNKLTNEELSIIIDKAVSGNNQSLEKIIINIHKLPSPPYKTLVTINTFHLAFYL